MPADIFDIRNVVIESMGVAMSYLRDVLAHPDDPNYTPKQKIDAAKQIASLASVILDRTDPRLSSSTNKQLTVNVELVREMAKQLPAQYANQLLQAVETRLLEAPTEPAGAPAARTAAGVAEASR